MKTKTKTKPKAPTIKFEMYPLMVPDDGMTYILRFSKEGKKRKIQSDYIPICEMEKIDKAISKTQVKIGKAIRKVALALKSANIKDRR